MRDGTIPTVRRSYSGDDLEETGSASYASGTGLLFIVVLIALSAIGLSLVSFAH